MQTTQQRLLDAAAAAAAREASAAAAGGGAAGASSNGKAAGLSNTKGRSRGRQGDVAVGVGGAGAGGAGALGAWPGVVQRRCTADDVRRYRTTSNRVLLHTGR